VDTIGQPPGNGHGFLGTDSGRDRFVPAVGKE
jgi:hypothetical protein